MTWKKTKDTEGKQKIHKEFEKDGEVVKFSADKDLGLYKLSVNKMDYSFPSTNPKGNRFVNVDEQYTVVNFNSKEEAVKEFNNLMPKKFHIDPVKLGRRKSKKVS